MPNSPSINGLPIWNDYQLNSLYGQLNKNDNVLCSYEIYFLILHKYLEINDCQLTHSKGKSTLHHTSLSWLTDTTEQRTDTTN